MHTGNLPPPAPSRPFPPLKVKVGAFRHGENRAVGIRQILCFAFFFHLLCAHRLRGPHQSGTVLVRDAKCLGQSGERGQNCSLYGDCVHPIFRRGGTATGRIVVLTNMVIAARGRDFIMAGADLRAKHVAPLVAVGIKKIHTAASRHVAAGTRLTGLGFAPAQTARYRPCDREGTGCGGGGRYLTCIPPTQTPPSAPSGRR